MHERPTSDRTVSSTAPKGTAGNGAAGLSVDPARFVEDVEPLLESNNLQGLVVLLDQHYGVEQICSLLGSDDADARKVAALSLALVGRADCIPSLARHLRDPDPMVNQMAEHALWSIWFRGGNCEANAHLMRGSEALNEKRVERAAEHFSAAIALSPRFAEAYNQRAIAYYLMEQFDESLEDGRRAAELMPYHFGAWAGMGHCHAHRGEFEAALRCYRRAVSINPHLDCVTEMVRELETHGSLDHWRHCCDTDGDDAAEQEAAEVNAVSKTDASSQRDNSDR